MPFMRMARVLFHFGWMDDIGRRRVISFFLSFRFLSSFLRSTVAGWLIYYLFYFISCASVICESESGREDKQVHADRKIEIPKYIINKSIKNKIHHRNVFHPLDTTFSKAKSIPVCCTDKKANAHNANNNNNNRKW